MGGNSSLDSPTASQILAEPVIVQAMESNVSILKGKLLVGGADSAELIEPPKATLSKSVAAMSLLALVYVLSSSGTTEGVALSAIVSIPTLLIFVAKVVVVFLVVSLAALSYFVGLQFSPRLVSVDPARILQALAAHGAMGSIDPKGLKMLQDFVNVSSAESARLDVFRNKLEVINFAVTPHVKDQNQTLPALTIGKLKLEWDFYDSKPCFNILVEDVHYLVEYTRNTPFTKSNWDELKEQGFPPEDDEEPPIQIGSFRMKGHLKLSIRSRPFHTDLIKPIKIKLRNLNDLFTLISQKSKEAKALKRSNARGLSFGEFGAIIDNYFKNKALELITAPPRGFIQFWHHLFNRNIQQHQRQM